jgi:hypothetical protein
MKRRDSAAGKFRAQADAANSIVVIAYHPSSEMAANRKKRCEVMMARFKGYKLCTVPA